MESRLHGTQFDGGRRLTPLEQGEDASPAFRVFESFKNELSRPERYTAYAERRKSAIEAEGEAGISDLVDWAETYCHIQINVHEYTFPSYGPGHSGPAQMHVGEYKGMEPAGWILHELGHWLASTSVDRGQPNYGLEGTGGHEAESLTSEEDALLTELWLLFHVGHSAQEKAEPFFERHFQPIRSRDPKLEYTGFTTDFPGIAELVSVVRRLPPRLLLGSYANS